MTLLHQLLAKIRGFFRSKDLDRDFERELEAHLALAEEEKIRRGLAPEEAYRQARIELGGVTQLREAGRAARGLPWLDTSLLDLKLGLRMLRKSWGLTLVGGLAMTLTIGLGAVVFAALDTVGESALPYRDGERIVAIQPYDPLQRQDLDTSLRDFQRWKQELKLVEKVGAFRSLPKLDSRGIRVSVAEISAAALGLTGVHPVLGRLLNSADELPEAEPVVLIGHEIWQSRFSGDATVLGKSLRLDGRLHRVIGVMPEDFAFPVNHLFWTPLQPAALEANPDPEPRVFVLARLAAGIRRESAAAEVAALGLVENELGGGRRKLETRVVPYASTFNDDLREYGWLVDLILIVVTLLLAPPCANIAILLYARNISRQDEFAARYVLGASRGRIVLQLLVEALLLATLAGAVGLLLASLLLGYLQDLINQQAPGTFPFWMEFNLSVKTAAFVALLAFLAALMAGGLPAWRATSRLRQSRLQTLGSRSGGLRLGRTWTALVMLQVGLSTAAMPAAVEVCWKIFRPALLGPGFAAEEYLSARLLLNLDEMTDASSGQGDQPLGERFSVLQSEVVRRLRAEAALAGVTVSARAPGEEGSAPFEIETGQDVGRPRVLASFNYVDESFFDVFDVPLLSGRVFQAADLNSGSQPIIVNRSMAEHVADGGNAVGRRIRTLNPSDDSETQPGPWYQIVGVVQDIPANREQHRVYQPLRPGEIHPVNLSLRVGVAIPESLPELLAQFSQSLDPALEIDRLRSLDVIYREQQVNNHLVGYALVSVMLCVFLFSVAGIYTLMFFTVARRRREIGIRSALGAHPIRLVIELMTRALLPVSLGAVLGGFIALLLEYYLTSGLFRSEARTLSGLVPVTEAIMVAVAFLALLGPIRQALQIEPTEALRED